MAVDDFATQGATASETLIFTYLNGDNSARTR